MPRLATRHGRAKENEDQHTRRIGYLTAVTGLVTALATLTAAVAGLLAMLAG